MGDQPARGSFDPVPSTRQPADRQRGDHAARRHRGRGARRTRGSRLRAAAGPRRRRRAPRGRRLHRDQRTRRSSSRAPTVARWWRWASATRATVDLTTVRDLAADFARAVPQHKTLAVELPETRVRRLTGRLRPGRRRGRPAGPLALLRRQGRRRADADRPDDRGPGGGGRRGARRRRARPGDRRGPPRSAATCPTARRPRCPRPAWREVAQELGPAAGLEVEVFDEQQLIEMGCGGILGVNLGSVDEPRLIRLRYRPDSPTGHLALVGKGIMYDSGGISLKPSDESHAQMKNDMTGAAAILGAMTALRDAGLRGRRHGVPVLHRQHAVGVGDEARRRPHHAQRHDRRGAEHRRRGPAGDGRRAVPGGRGRRRRDRRHRHPHRCLPAHARGRDRRR